MEVVNKKISAEFGRLLDLINGEETKPLSQAKQKGRLFIFGCSLRNPLLSFFVLLVLGFVN